MIVFFGCFFFQLKIDEFESNVNEVKDPFPPADFPGNLDFSCISNLLLSAVQLQ